MEKFRILSCVDKMDLDVMQIESFEANLGMRDTVAPNDRTDFSKVNNANAILIAWKALMKKQVFCQEVEKFFKRPYVRV